MKSAKYKFIMMLLFAPVVLLGFMKSADPADPFVSALRNMVQSFYKNKQWEKVYLHIDKPLYKPGEDIWFKAHVTDGATGKPSAMSDVLYVELINPRGNVDKVLSLQVIQGICFGNFTIDESYNGGIYKVKAYTSWMRNFGDDYFFEKEIQVQKVVYPRLLARIDFSRESFSPGDTVNAVLSVSTLENVPLAFKKAQADFSVEGEKVYTSPVETDNKGKSTLRFVLPENMKTADALVNIKINHDGNTEAISRSIPVVLNNIDVQFFPEGGYMISNVPANVAFKAVNEFGKPAEIEGYITDNLQNRVLEFSSFHQGMGSFSMTPLPGKRYFAVITKPKTGKKIELPEVMPAGYSLQLVSRQGNKYKLVYYTPKKERITVAVQAGNKIWFSRSERSGNGANEMVFDAADFPAGIALVTLFDTNGTPRCERLIYCHYHKRLNISFKFDKEKYSPREKIKLRIRTTGSDSIPVSANLSLAVVNDQLLTMADDKQHHIVSWLMLGSEIRGKIEKPSFYFNPDEPKAERSLDYLLLTQGWRRYNWDDLLKMNYNVKYPGERIGSLSGVIQHKRTGEPLQAEVVVMELDNRRRILKVNTGVNGRFRFEGADVASHLQILARNPKVNVNDIVIVPDNLKMISVQAANRKGEAEQDLVPDVIKIKAEVNNNQNQKNKPAQFAKVKAVADEVMPDAAGNEMILKEDEARLEEVVVIGYGTQKKSDLTGAVALVNPGNNNKLVPVTVEQIMQGRASGIQVINDNGQAGLSPKVVIRGTGTMTHNQPLYVIDGVIFDPSLSGNVSPLQNIPPSNIESISVLKDASASAIYGSKASKGVIIVNTVTRQGYYKNIPKGFKPQYSGLLISPRKMSPVKEFYYPVYRENQIPEVREDFRPTIYWNPNITTNHAGEANVEFYASDEITTFRAVAEGIGNSGECGRTESKFHTQLPFSMAVKFPAYLSFGDTVLMPLIVKNNTPRTINGKLKFSVPESVKPLEILPDSLVIESFSTRTVYIPFFVRNLAGKDKLTVHFTGNGFRDAFVQETEVQPKGFPTTLSVSGKEMEKRFGFSISKPVAGSLKAELSAFPDILSDLMAGVESILREPYGCFEQTSSSTYPNIMVLSYLNETNTANRSVSDRALALIKTGYNRLIGFETNTKGYEWFGKSPAHDGLTAYGLMEFVDMEKVYNGVDRQMIERTKNWILDQRDGRGGFVRNPMALDGFGRASGEVTNAYIVYALSEAGVTQILPEYKAAFAEVRASCDPYRLSLMANAAFNLKRTDEGNMLLLLLLNKLEKSSWEQLQIDHSITRSYGKSLQVETAALFTMALLKTPKPDWKILSDAVNFLISSRAYGGFGSTQATILALKALTGFSKQNSAVSSDGTIEIEINGIKASTYAYKKSDKGKIILNGLEKYLHEGKNEVVVRFLNTSGPLPYTFDAVWNSSTPATDSECKVALQTSLSAHHTRAGETVRLNVILSNRTNDGLPMTLAVIGIPSGLSLQPWQLKEIQEKEQVDFYEVSKNYLVLYYRQMIPGEQRQLHLDLRAEIPGNYVAPASCAYLYYTKEFKYWTDGETVKCDK